MSASKTGDQCHRNQSARRHKQPATLSTYRRDAERGSEAVGTLGAASVPVKLVSESCVRDLIEWDAQGRRLPIERRKMQRATPPCVMPRLSNRYRSNRATEARPIVARPPPTGTERRVERRIARRERRQDRRIIYIYKAGRTASDATRRSYGTPRRSARKVRDATRDSAMDVARAGDAGLSFLGYRHHRLAPGKVPERIRKLRRRRSSHHIDAGRQHLHGAGASTAVTPTVELALH
jgi:hypothetical protein